MVSPPCGARRRPLTLWAREGVRGVFLLESGHPGRTEGGGPHHRASSRLSSFLSKPSGAAPCSWRVLGTSQDPGVGLFLVTGQLLCSDHWHMNR